jgi:ribonuclease HI
VKFYEKDVLGVEECLKGYEEKTTNNRMEMTAVIEALEKVPYKNASVVITTDSKYVKDGITQYIVSWKKNHWRKADKKPVLNQDLWKKLDAVVSTFKSIEWNWTKGHAGHPENEKCDRIAGEQTERCRELIKKRKSESDDHSEKRPRLS